VADDPDTVIYRISGVFFFGAAASVGSVLDRIADQRRNFVLDCADVPLLDSTAASVIEGLVRKAERAGVRVFITGLKPDMRRLLEAHELHAPRVTFTATVESALEEIATFTPLR
jgi:SulP family sulfate permease